MFKVNENYRLKQGPMASTKIDGNNGMFIVPIPIDFISPHELMVKKSHYYKVIASDGAGWEHVSVSLNDRTPTWDEMCFIKDLFWGEDDCVIQFHPAKQKYVNNHPYCLHLWRPTDNKFPKPPSVLVGLQ